MINEHDIKDMQPANDKQIGGTHYKKYGDVQPWDVIVAWNLGYLEGTALKYIARWRDKGGIADIEKAIHFLEKFVEVEKAKQDPRVAKPTLPTNKFMDYRTLQAGYSQLVWPTIIRSANESE